MGQQGLLLHGKCALITGASKGIGSAIAEAFAREGAELVLVGRSEDSLQEVQLSCVIHAVNHLATQAVMPSHSVGGGRMPGCWRCKRGVRANQHA